MRITTRYLLKRYEETVKKLNEKKDNEIWVTELVQCKLKSVYAKEYPIAISDNLSLLIGELVHKGFLEWLAKELNAKIEVEVQRQYRNFVIKGRIDALTDDCVYEVKYMKEHLGDEPLEHHVRQLRLYMWMVDVQHGKLIYITNNRFCEYDVDRPIVDSDVEVLLHTWDAPRYDWECKYCPYAFICEKARIPKR